MIKKGSDRLEIENITKLLQEELGEEKVLLEEPMAKHTSFKIGGPAQFFVYVDRVDELLFLQELAKKENLPFMIVGNGSNLLVKDGGIRGIVAKLQMKQIEKEEKGDDVYLLVEAGIPLAFLAQQCFMQEITGLEFASGIPGTVGSAIYMNAGAHGKEMKDVVATTTYLDEQGHFCTRNNSEHEFSYRHSKFQEEKAIILSCVLVLKKGKKDEIAERMEEYRNYRKEKQPIDKPSAGSTFKRGEGYITAALIDACGLKGYSIGDAQVSEKHAGFLVNKGKATAKDMIKLIHHVEKTIKDKYQKELKLEIKIVGED